MDKAKKRIYEIIQIGNRSDVPSLAMDIFIVANILINIACMFLATFDEFDPYMSTIRVVELITVCFFCIEYALRIWTAPYLYQNESANKARLHYLRSYDGIVDLLTILPFFFLSGFVVFRMLRVVRIFHLFRINAQYDSFNVITSVLYERRNQIFSSVFIIFVLMCGSSLCMYSAEHEAQPEVFKNAFSGIWWSMSTLLTVGYGDIYPITTLGQIMAIIIAFLGVGAVAIPTGIISAGFVEAYSRFKNVDMISENHNVQFVSISISKGDKLANTTIKDANIPKGLVIVTVERDDDVLIPRGDLKLCPGDKLCLAAENYDNEYDMKVQEVHVGNDHEWANQKIRDLDISRQTTIVSIKRGNEVIIPNGSTVIKVQDKVVLFTKRAKGYSQHLIIA